MSTPAFADLVARGGVVAPAQVAATGVPARTVRRWARAWRRLYPGIYLVAGHRLTHEARVRAALLWAGPDAVLTGQGAAHWLGLPVDAPAVPQVTVPARALPRALPPLLPQHGPPRVDRGGAAGHGRRRPSRLRGRAPSEAAAARRPGLRSASPRSGTRWPRHPDDSHDQPSIIGGRCGRVRGRGTPSGG
jgi:hypothetical protein